MLTGDSSSPEAAEAPLGFVCVYMCAWAGLFGRRPSKLEAWSEGYAVVGISIEPGGGRSREAR